MFRGPNGAAAGVAAQHSQCFGAWYSQCPGLKVVWISIIIYQVELGKHSDFKWVFKFSILVTLWVLDL